MKVRLVIISADGELRLNQRELRGYIVRSSAWRERVPDHYPEEISSLGPKVHLLNQADTLSRHGPASTLLLLRGIPQWMRTL
jgi:hypothetical protein